MRMLSPRTSRTRTPPGSGSSSARPMQIHSQKKIRSRSLAKISSERYHSLGRDFSSAIGFVALPPLVLVVLVRRHRLGVVHGPLAAVGRHLPERPRHLAHVDRDGTA